MSVIVAAALYGVVIPGTVAVVLMVLFRPWRADRAPHRVTAALLSAIAVAGYLAGHWGIIGAPEAKPLNIHEWLPHFVLLGMLGAFFDAAQPERAVAREAVRLALSTIIAWLLLRPLLAYRWPGFEGAAIVSLAGGSLTIYWSTLQWATRNATPRPVATLLLIVCAATATCAGLSKSAALGQLAGAGTAAVGAVWLATLLFRASPDPRGAIGFVAPFTWSVGAISLCYAEMQASVALLLAAIPASFALVGWAARKRFARASTMAIAIAALVAAGAVIGAMNIGETAAPSDDDSDYGYGYDNGGTD